MNPALIRRVTVRPPRERGSAAIELALVLPVLLVFLTFPVFYARCLWQYTMAQKAAQDAARYLSTVSAAEMRSPTLATAAANTAMQIVTMETAELATASPVQGLTTYCGTLLCGVLPAGTLPSTVRVHLMIYMRDDLFGLIDTGRYGIPVTADVTMRYVGI